MKLFTIGDSISQGVMSGAAARSDLSYSAIIARLLYGNDVTRKYHMPEWPAGGIPFNIETLMRRLEYLAGADISGPLEWPAAADCIIRYIDEVEDFYERGAGGLHTVLPRNAYHNVSVRGFDVAHSWLVHPALAKAEIATSQGNHDGIFSLPAEANLRVAQHVLGAGSPAETDSFTQLDWLRHHHSQSGVENLFLWLGANNALGTVLDLQIRQTSNSGDRFASGSIGYRERKAAGWNLWHPEDFRAEYRQLMERVTTIMDENPKGVVWNVFIATIPLVTICPVIKAAGIEEREEVSVTEWPVDLENPAPLGSSELRDPVVRECSYGRYYPHFLFADHFDKSLPHLNLAQVLHIDDTIRAYNRIIMESVAEANRLLGVRRFWLVDIASCLSALALRRNRYKPTYRLPDYFRYAYPRIDTRFFGSTRKGEMVSGGIFSLDGVHPTAIGQGIIAREFLQVMKRAGCFAGDPDTAIDWRAIAAADTLYSRPPALMSEWFENIPLKKWIYRLIYSLASGQSVKRP